MILEELQQLASRRNIDELTDRVNGLLPQMTEQALEKIRPIVEQLIQQEVQKIQRKVRNGKDGKPGPRGPKGEKGDPGSPDTPEQVRDKLQSLKGEDRLDASAIKNLPKTIRSLGSVSKGGGSTMRVDNLSSQADGSNKTFITTYKIGSAHLLFYSSFPSILVPTTDYTVSGNTITLGDNVDAPAQGQSLAIIYEEG